MKSGLLYTSLSIFLLGIVSGGQSFSASLWGFPACKVKRTAGTHSFQMGMIHKKIMYVKPLHSAEKC